MDYEVVPGPVCQWCHHEIEKPTHCDMELFRIGIYLHLACAERMEGHRRAEWTPVGSYGRN